MQVQLQQKSAPMEVDSKKGRGRSKNAGSITERTKNTGKSADRLGLN